MIWAIEVARYGENKGTYEVLVGKSKENEYMGHPSVGDMIILRMTFKKYG
jgi:hypothetical protein